MKLDLFELKQILESYVFGRAFIQLDPDTEFDRETRYQAIENAIEFVEVKITNPSGVIETLINNGVSKTTMRYVLKEIYDNYVAYSNETQF